MNYYLIKSINCIVSNEFDSDDTEFYFLLDNEEILFCDRILDDGRLLCEGIDTAYEQKYCKKVLFSNNNSEGLKPFELIDEEAEELAFKEYPVTEFEDEFDYRYRDGFKVGYKAKAGGYTESQMIGFAEFVYETKFDSFIGRDGNAQWIITGIGDQSSSTKELLTLYLTEQESRPIEVIQISENQFKIKK